MARRKAGGAKGKDDVNFNRFNVSTVEDSKRLALFLSYVDPEQDAKKDRSPRKHSMTYIRTDKATQNGGQSKTVHRDRDRDRES